MNALITKYKPTIDQAIETFLETKKQSLSPVNEWGTDVPSRYTSFVNRGKSVRGSLFLATAEALGGNVSELLPIAAALEIIHAAILVHDDIIDNDTVRRGIPTLTAQYNEIGRERSFTGEGSFGNNMSIVAGDIGFFWAFELLTSTSLPPAIAQRIIQTIAQEFVLVGLGEMEDVAVSGNPSHPPLAKIESLYRYKTARYTFSLPFLCAALVTEQSQSFEESLVTIGESMGLVFQLRDDELSLFGDPKKTGKTVGNDIRENKKTPYLLRLMEVSSAEEKTKLSTIFGNPDSSNEDISTVLDLLTSHQVETYVNAMRDEYAKKATTAIQSLPLSDTTREFFRSMLSFLATRDR